MSGFSPETVRKIIDRDRNCCALCGRQVFGERGRQWSVHHRQPRGMGSSKKAYVNAPGNGVLLHGSGVSQCHGWVESHRQLAVDMGFIVLHGKRLPTEVAILHKVHGLVILDDFGNFHDQEPAF